MADDKNHEAPDRTLAKSRPSELLPISGGSDGPPEVIAKLERSPVPATPDQSLWTAIRYATDQLSYDSYEAFMEVVMCADEDSTTVRQRGEAEARAYKNFLRGARALPFPDVEPYRLLKIATEVFLMVHCGVAIDQSRPDDPIGDSPFPKLGPKRFEEEKARYYRTLGKDEILQSWREYREEIGRDHEPHDPGDKIDYTLPYLAIIRRKLGDVPLRDKARRDAEHEWLELCYGIMKKKLTEPCLLELIWSYWHEEGMLVQTMNALGQRFQNVRGGPNNPLAQLEISPLRPLSNLLWGYIQDEQHRLTVRRRVYEYDHHYGLGLYGKAVPELSAADSRSKFLEGFHNLLQLCAVFFKQDDDKTVAADGFPILNALKDVHLLLSEGAHNQYGDLPWTARMEMLMQQWILARTEFREFLPTRIMVAYPEPWMDRVDAMKKLQGWSDVSVLHFRNLGVFGEQVLLSIRFGAWSDVNDRNQAANWARYWRAEIQGYLHAYRAATGVDITDTTEATARLRYVQPSVHLRNRLAAQPSALPAGSPMGLPVGARPAALPANTAASRATRESGW
jgi:hypothetical protein